MAQPTFNQSASKIINGALRLCSAIASGESPDSDEQTDAMDALNAMVKAWMASGIHVWAEIEGTVFLQPSQNTYSIGTGTTDAVTQTWGQTTLTATAAAAATSLKRTLEGYRRLIADLSSSLTDEGPGWSNEGVHNLRCRVANALPPAECPDWLEAYRDPPIVRSA